MNAAPASPTAPSAGPGKPTTLSPTDAFAAAQRSWASSLVIAVVGLVVITGVLLSRENAAEATATTATAAEPSSLRTVGGLLVGLAVAWLALLGPVVLVLRSYCFRLPGTAGDRAVEPGSYLKGMSSIWGVLTVGAMLSLIGAALSGDVMPGGLVALVAVMLLGMVKPDKRALGLSGD